MSTRKRYLYSHHPDYPSSRKPHQLTCPSLFPQTLLTLEQFKSQNEEYAMSNGIYQDAIAESTSAQVSDDAVHELLGKLADDAGVALNAELNSPQPVPAEPETTEPTAEEEDRLQQRLRALRA
jgi:charged multivesicular body protein 1